MLKENWGEIIKNRREELGLSQEEVAKFLQKTRNHIHNLESQKRPPKAHELGIIASVLGIDISELYTTGNHLSVLRLIQAGRLSKGLSIADLAKLADIPFFKLGRAELGEEELSANEIHRLAKVLEIDDNTLRATKKVSVSTICDSARELGLSEPNIKLLKEFLEDCLK